MRTTHVWAVIQEWMDAQFFKVTASALAEKVGVSRSAMSQWKLGESTPKPEHLRKLAEVTRVPYDRFLDALVRDLGYIDEEGGEGHAERPAPRTPAGPGPALTAVPDVDGEDKPSEGLIDEPPPGGWTDETQAFLDDQAAREGEAAQPPDGTTGEESQLRPEDEA